jgi:hypothetical protein
MSPAELELHWNRSVLEAVEQAVIRIIAKATEFAETYCQKYPGQEAHFFVGNLRRTEIESALAALADQFPEIEVESRTTAPRTAHYRAIKVGSFFLTVSHVRDRLDFPPDAHFRKNLGLTCQMLLIEDAYPHDGDGHQYGIVVYCVEPKAKFPSFIDVAFPNRDGTDWAARIKILPRHEALVNELKSSHIAAVEVVPEEAEPKFKEGQQEKGST